MPEKQNSVESKTSSNANSKASKQQAAAPVAPSSNKDAANPPQSKESSVAKDSTPSPNDAQSQVQALVDRRIRNLEKRKSRLETLREEAKGGKELNDDQKKAVSKYDDVLESLEFLRDLTKNMTKIFADALAAKKKAEKEEQSRRQKEEKERIKSMLLLRDVLATVITDSNVRSKLLAKNNNEKQANSDQSNANDSEGSDLVTLDEDKLKHLSDLFVLVNPDRKKNENFKTQVDNAADRLISLADGKKKDFVKGFTYSEMKATLLSIAKSGLISSNSARPAGGKGNQGSKKNPQQQQQQQSTQQIQSQQQVPVQHGDKPIALTNNSPSSAKNATSSGGGVVTGDGHKMPTGASQQVVNQQQQQQHTLANVTLPPQAAAALAGHISFGSLGSEVRPEQDPAVVSILPSYPHSGNAATIPSQVFTNPNYAANVFVPPHFMPNGPYMVQTPHMMTQVQTSSAAQQQQQQQPQQQQLNQQQQQLTGQVSHTGGPSMNGQGILPTPDTLPDHNTADYVSGQMTGLNLNDGNNGASLVNSQMQSQQTGHVHKVPGDSDFRRRDHKAQFTNQFQKRNFNDGRNPRNLDHHGSSKAFQRNKQDRYQSGANLGAHPGSLQHSAGHLPPHAGYRKDGDFKYSKDDPTKRHAFTNNRAK